MGPFHGTVSEGQLRHVPAEILERRPLELPITLLGVQLDKSAGVGERDEWELERRLLRRDEVPGGEGALESCAGRPSEVTNTRSHMRVAETIRTRPSRPSGRPAFAMAGLQVGPGAIGESCFGMAFSQPPGPLLVPFV